MVVAVLTGALALQASALVALRTPRQMRERQLRPLCCSAVPSEQTLLSCQPDPGAELMPKHHIMIGNKMITPDGFRMGFMVFLVAFLVQIPIMLAYLVGDRERQHTIDHIIGFWAFASMRLSGYSPHIAGLEHLPRGPAVYVVNHTSFLDILTLSGFIPRPLKYISKESILKIPLIGWPMKLAGHVPLGTSRRSQAPPTLPPG